MPENHVQVAVHQTMPHISKPHFEGGPLESFTRRPTGLVGWSRIFFVGIRADEVV
ncbi:48ca07c5-abef-4cbd-8b00-e01ea25f7dcc [Sclerotinia trifoliorum]|uniref:48ca07c5-abef-4cbd-8b00-e01ea25f7dcc n=1 Tax=Sclerotinia trifoliorum TaxID=28548 RepID=A0A8H2ZLA0_9HELO|nr:48ca07c5-abef-4cbd-8b00-e01ea25f7dcc [Sclerotinia trifoliorum]